MYGPVPTGLALAYVAGLPALLQIAWGKMAVPAISSRFVYWDAGNVSVTVLPDVETPESFRPPRLIAAFFLIRLNVKATSAGVSGFSSFPFTPEPVGDAVFLSPAAP